MKSYETITDGNITESLLQSLLSSLLFSSPELPSMSSYGLSLTTLLTLFIRYKECLLDFKKASCSPTVDPIPLVMLLPADGEGLRSSVHIRRVSILKMVSRLGEEKTHLFLVV